MDETLLRVWYRGRPFGKRTFQETIALQIALRAHEEGMTREAFEQACMRRNGEGTAYFLGCRAYSASPSRFLAQAQL
jgi:hypothetical protein